MYRLVKTTCVILPIQLQVFPKVSLQQKHSVMEGLQITVQVKKMMVDLMSKRPCCCS